MRRNHVRAWKSIIVAFVLTTQLHSGRMSQHPVCTKDVVHVRSHHIAQAEGHRLIHLRRHIIDADNQMCFILSEF